MKLKSGLTQIGFTEYEARIYLALLAENPATGYQLSKKTGVPRSMVYEALGRLSVRGAVMETIEERSTLYRPLPPASLLDQSGHELKNTAQDLRQGLGELFSAEKDQRVWSISGSAPVHSYAAQMIRMAKEEIFLVLSDADLLSLEGELNLAQGRGLSLNTLLTGSAEFPNGRVAYHQPAESEMQDLTEIMMVVIDSREVLIASSSPSTTATITCNHNLVRISRQFIWMELLTQYLFKHLGMNSLKALDPEVQKLILDAFS